jgi:hypothetical protein
MVIGSTGSPSASGSIGHRPRSPRPGRALKATDTRAAGGNCFLEMFDVFAEFARNLRRERRLEGIAKAKPAAA